MVCTCAAATSSTASSQSARTSPPLPRALWYVRRLLGVRLDVPQARTGSFSRRFASLYISSSTPRMYG